MTPPEWPAGIDYDEWIAEATKGLHNNLSWCELRPGFKAYPREAAHIVLIATAPLIAKAVEEAEADAERLAEALRRSGLGFQHPSKDPAITKGTLTPSSTTLEARDALAAHEARKAGR